jgi:hypothetical protein
MRTLYVLFTEITSFPRVNAASVPIDVSSSRPERRQRPKARRGWREASRYEGCTSSSRNPPPSTSRAVRVEQAKVSSSRTGRPQRPKERRGWREAARYERCTSSSSRSPPSTSKMPGQYPSTSAAAEGSAGGRPKRAEAGEEKRDAHVIRPLHGAHLLPAVRDRGSS